ncbi:hypothetical protein LJC42_03450 [Eubacteriales bacterium OttesenSCG-928-K08]|nr:hypothetical protein [Eubacteriales bacterium OttesenSCG-928-K08]
MEVTNRQQVQRLGMRDRVYAPGRADATYQYGTAVPNYVPQPQQRPAPRVAPRPKRQARVQRRLSSAARVALMVTVALLGASALVVVMGYYTIAESYMQVNELNEQIDQAQTRIRALNIELEYSANIYDVQAAAQRLGMSYPAAEQYVRAGDVLPTRVAPLGVEEQPELPQAE